MTKGEKRKRSETSSDGVDFEDGAEEEEKLVPMPESNGIEALRRKLQNRMTELRNRGQSASREAGDRDALLEERRRQRAEMRERRRKETKEKIKREEETRGKKNKEKREEKQKGSSTRVGHLGLTFIRADNDNISSHNSLFLIIQGHPHATQALRKSSRMCHLAILSASLHQRKPNDSKPHRTLNKRLNNLLPAKGNLLQCRMKSASP